MIEDAPDDRILPRIEKSETGVWRIIKAHPKHGQVYSSLKTRDEQEARRKLDEYRAMLEEACRRRIRC